VTPEWSRQYERDGRVPAGQLVASRGQVFGHVPTRRQKVRDHYNQIGSTCDTHVPAGRNRRLAQLQVGRLDDDELAARPKGGCETVEVGIRLGPAAAMGDQEQRG
jgi:hypothetical protein